MEKYRIREEEAEQLSDFLLPMLEWYPERRATAQDILAHPWLNMQANYDTTMNEAEFQKMMLKSKLLGKEDDNNKEMSELCDSEDDLFRADSEDNNRSNSDNESDSEFYNLTK